MKKQKKQKTRTFRKCPELVEGIRVQFKDKNEATRSGRIISRHGSMVTIRNPLNQKYRVDVGRVIGYWKPRVQANVKNLVLI